jgi:hypothetical protein
MAFLGQDPVRCKIVMDNKYLQHVENFKYRGKLPIEKKSILNKK